MPVANCSTCAQKCTEHKGAHQLKLALQHVVTQTAVAVTPTTTVIVRFTIVISGLQVSMGSCRRVAIQCGHCCLAGRACSFVSDNRKFMLTAWWRTGPEELLQHSKVLRRPGQARCKL
jgi:hypothetical protein